MLGPIETCAGIKSQKKKHVGSSKQVPGAPGNM